MIAWSEGTSRIPGSDNGYNVLVGATSQHPLLFKSYADHPRIINHALNSTAAGRYQLLARYFDAYKASLHLSDFSPASQDLIALQQIRECKALDDIDAGEISAAVNKCGRIWASFPGSPYGQRQNKISDLITIYEKAGGTILATA